MRTIPAAWAAIALTGNDHAREVCSKHLVRLGERVEVLVDEVASDKPEIGAILRTFAERMYAQKNLTEHSSVIARLAKQQASGTGKKDLTEEYEALKEHATLGAITDTLLNKDLNKDELGELASAVGADVTYEGDTTVVTIWLPVQNMPDVLGGPIWPGEDRRGIRLTARHANWRDRQVRRLARVEALARIAHPPLAETTRQPQPGLSAL